MPVTIDRSGIGRWRYTCPHGHIRWEKHEKGVWCIPCERTPEFGGGRHQIIIDQKTRRELPIEEVEQQ